MNIFSIKPMLIVAAALAAGVSVYIGSQDPQTRRQNQAMEFFSSNFKDWNISRRYTTMDNPTQKTTSFKFELEKQRSRINICLTCNENSCTMDSLLFGSDTYE